MQCKNEYPQNYIWAGHTVLTGIPVINCSQPLLINSLKKTQKNNSNQKNGFIIFFSLVFPHSREQREGGPSHSWCCSPDNPPGWLSLHALPSQGHFLDGTAKSWLIAAKQAALVLLRSKHWALGPKYSVFEDVVELGFKPLTSQPISNVIQISVNFLICCSHSHRTLLEAEYRRDCKKINCGKF